MDLITCKNLSYTYDGTLTAVEDLDFSVEENDYLCIVGENGAGKSTLIKGLLQLKEPASGTITYADGLKATDIGYLPQQTPLQRDFPASVMEVVLSGCLNKLGGRPFYTREHKDLALGALSRMGISYLAKRCYRDLSGGQQQRVLLARALCATSRLLLLDEPAASLDPMATQELYRLISEINREMGITVIMVSHDIQSSLKYAKHILQLQRTQLFFGTAEDYEESNIGNIFMNLGGGAL